MNDQVLDTVEADASASGDVGLLAGSFEKPGARVRFDDFAAKNGVSVTSTAGGEILFTDDFSDANSGWDVRKPNNGSSGYRDGRYFIRVNSPKYQLWSTAGQDFTADVIVDATAGSIAGPQKNEMGVICRYVEIVFDDFEVIRP